MPKNHPGRLCGMHGRGGSSAASQHGHVLAHVSKNPGHFFFCPPQTQPIELRFRAGASDLGHGPQQQQQTLSP